VRWLSRRTLLLALGGLVLLVVAAVVLVPRLSTTRVESAVGMLPESTLRASYTDWERVATEADGSPDSLDAFLGRAFEQDLTNASALSSLWPAIAANYELTPFDVEWEVYGQGRDGAVDLLRLGDGVDLSALEDRLRSLGYESPSSPDGVWTGSPELVVGFDDPLSTLQQNLAIVEGERILVMSDTAGYADSAVDAVTGRVVSLDAAEGVPELADLAQDATVAVLWASDFACEDLSMSSADAVAAEEGASLVSEAGGVHPLEGLVMAQHASSLTVGMFFASSDQASDDLQARADLAAGPAPGQGGTFPERFEVVDATAEDRVVTLELDPVDGPVLGDLGQGPVLFATC
jgi:hypothetical protein